jgi:hypothetical protein
MLYPVGQFLPDQPALGNPGSLVAENVIAGQDFYRPLNSLGTFSVGATTARVQGGFSCIDKDGGIHTFAGDTTKLYELSGALAWTNVSRTSGGAYATESDGYWEFTQWGNKVIAANGVDKPQIITLGAANFADLSGSPPVADTIAPVRNFVFLGNLTEGGVNFPFRVRWSGFEDETTWTPSATTQSDFNDILGNGGAVQRIIGGEYATIIQENQVIRATYTGDATIFQFDVIEQAHGSPAPGSVVYHKGLIYYWTDAGIVVLVGYKSNPIGAERVDRFVYNELDFSNIRRVVGAAHPTEPLIVWAYPATGNANGNPNRLLIYNYVVDRWSTSGLDDIILETIFSPTLTPGIHTDNVDSLLVVNTDTITYQTDSRFFNSTAQDLGAFTTDHKLGFFNSTTLEATVDTSERQLFEGHRSMISGARPLIDGGSPTVAAITRNLPTDPVQIGTDTGMNANGMCPLRVDARYCRFRIKVPAASSWSHMQGVDVMARPSGAQ